MLELIVQWTQQNQNKDITIEPIAIKIISDSDDNHPVPTIGPGKVSIIPLDPPGPVSLYLWHTNPEYRAGSFLTRKTILRENLVSLNEKFQIELKGRSWNRKKAIEELQSLDTAAVSPQQSFPELSRALCHVLGFQYAEIDENSKRILPFPKDLRSWTNESPVYLASYGCRSVYIKPGAEEARGFFKIWFTDLINEGYRYEWPCAEGTVKELKEQLSSFHLSLSPKAKKEEYSDAVGKAQAIRHINNEFT